MGYLTIDTLKGILLELEPNLGDEQLMEIVEEVDEDGSGTIDFDGKLIITRLWMNIQIISVVVYEMILITSFYVFAITEFMGMMMG